MADRGLGWAHQQDRARALAMFRDGDPCAICGRPMRAWQAKDLHHLIDRCFGGTGGPGNTALAHSSCNRRSGQKITTAINRLRNRGRFQKPRQIPLPAARRTITERNRRRW